MKDSKFFKDGFCDTIKAEMIRQGVTIGPLAKKTGYTYEGVRQIINGKGSYLGVYKVCKSLKMNMSKVLKSNPCVDE